MAKTSSKHPVSERPTEHPLSRPIISVHFPKASGTAFRVALQAAFGDAVKESYDASPAEPMHPMWMCPPFFMRMRPRTIAPYRVVHGHFPPHEYDLIADAVRITMLRDPVDTMVSIYFYWRSIADMPNKGALHELAIREGLSLLEVAEMPLLRRLMSRTFFGDYDMRRFDVIGDYARRGEFFAAVSARTGATLSPNEVANVTPPSGEREEATADTKLMRRLRDLLQDDIRFYEANTGSRRGRLASKSVFQSLPKLGAGLSARRSARL